MKQKLWEASSIQKKNSLLSNYEQFISKKFKKNFNQKYENILKWSIKNPGNFWSSIWDFSEIKGNKSKLKIKKSKIFYKNKFLPNSKLNFAENLLSKNNKMRTFSSTIRSCFSLFLFFMTNNMWCGKNYRYHK